MEDLKLKKLRETIGKLAYTFPEAGKTQTAIDAICEYIENSHGKKLLLQWLLTYIGDPGLIGAGMRIVYQVESEPLLTPEEPLHPHKY